MSTEHGQERPLRKLDFRGAVAHCAPQELAVTRDIRAAADRSDDREAYMRSLREQASRAA